MTRRLCRGQRGFSLIETVLGVAIASSVTVATVVALGTGVRAGSRANESVTLVQLATAQVETIQRSPFEADVTDYPIIADIPDGFSVAWASTDPGTVYAYPASLGTSITGTIQRITVTSTGDTTSVGLIFYKIDSP